MRARLLFVVGVVVSLAGFFFLARWFSFWVARRGAERCAAYDGYPVEFCEREYLLRDAGWADQFGSFVVVPAIVGGFLLLGVVALGFLVLSVVQWVRFGSEW